MQLPSDLPLYAIALGSNRPGRHGGPADEVRAAVAALATISRVVAVSPIISTAPVGPSIRRYTNAAALIACDALPPLLFARLKAIEHAFGRRAGQRWGARVIDLDIILWSEGAWGSRALTVPHPAFRQRDFVLGPLVRLVPDWRDPLTGLTIRQLARRQRG
jgi:2-amino-4-hydroxy-6-hydroxymethyldihydropteridine diphosphokinase